jgi:hypothetical protein
MVLGFEGEKPEVKNIGADIFWNKQTFLYTSIIPFLARLYLEQ